MPKNDVTLARLSIKILKTQLDATALFTFLVHKLPGDSREEGLLLLEKLNESIDKSIKYLDEVNNAL